MAKTIFLLSVFATSRAVVNCQGICADSNTCSIPASAEDVSKSAALLQVSRKARKEDVSPARNSDDVFRQGMPLSTQLGDLLTKVQSLEAIATPSSKEEAPRTVVAYDRAMGGKMVDEASVDTGVGKSRFYVDVPDKQLAAIAVAPKPELDDAFTKAVEERVAERKVLADKAAFDAAVEKAVDEKLAAEGIYPVSSGDARIGMPADSAMQTAVRDATTQQVAAERENDKLDRIDTSAEKQRDQNIVIEEKTAKEHNSHDWKQSAQDKVEKEETARGKDISKEDKIDDRVAKWIGDDLSGKTSESETYQKQHKKSHSGHSVEGYGEHRGDSGDSHHAHHHSGKDRDRHTVESHHHHHTHEGHSHDDDSESRFMREASGKKHLYDNWDEKDRVKSHEREDADESWEAGAKKKKGKSNENERRFMIEPVREETKAKQHWNSAEKAKKSNRENGRKVIVDPKEKFSDDFPYEMLMDVDFIVDATPDSDSIEDNGEMKGHSNRGNSKWGEHAEKHGRKKKASSKSEGHSKSSSETETWGRESDEFRSGHDGETPERDEEAEEIIFDQQKFKQSEKQKHMKKMKNQERDEDNEDLED